MKRALVAAVLFAAGALSASTQNATFVHKTPVGQVLSIDESALIDADLDVQLPDGLGGRTKIRWKLLEQKTRVFQQKVVESSEAGRTLELFFDTAIKETLKPPSKDRVKQNTSIHHRRIWASYLGDAIVRIEPTPPDSLVSPAAPADGTLAPPAAPGAGAAAATPAIADEDKGDILFAEKLYSTLPKGEVKPGHVWAIEPEAVGRAIFGFAYNPSLHTVDGRCQYKGMVTFEGKKCARVLMQLKGSGQIGDLTQAFQLEMAPEGFLHFAVDDGYIVSYELTGPIRISAGQAALQIAAAGPGRSVIRHKAKLKEKGGEEKKAAGESK